jgi:hypothetical protein
MDPRVKPLRLHLGQEQGQEMSYPVLIRKLPLVIVLSFTVVSAGV